MTCAAALAQQPRIDGLSPSQGPIAGGTMVAVRGANFAGAAVTLDRAPIAPLSQTDSEIRLQMPKRDNGYALLSVRNTKGIAYAEFLYIPPALSELPPGAITTIAGVGPYQQNFGLATETSIHPAGLAFDRAGNLFIAEPSENRVTRVDPAGNFSTFAGIGLQADSFHPAGDGGLAVDARVTFPSGVATDGVGNVLIADKDGQRLRRVDATTGVITSIAGDGVAGFSGDGGPASAARVRLPNAVAVDADGSIVFTDSGNMRVRQISADGTIRTIAGTGERGFSGDGGPAIAAKVDLLNSDVGSIAIDRHGNIFFCDVENARVRRIDAATAIITTVFGPNDERGDPIGDLAKVAVGSNDSLYCAFGGIIVRIEPSGRATRWGGGTPSMLPAEGVPAAGASLGFISGLALDASGNIFYSETFFNRVHRIDSASGLLSTVAGIGPRIPHETGPAVAAVLRGAGPLAFLPSGDLLVGDGVNFRIRRISRDGTISAFAGNGSGFVGPLEETPATETPTSPAGIDVDAEGNVFFVDVGNLVRKIDRAGIVHRVAGGNGGGLSGDGGPALQARFQQPWDVALDSHGNVLVADTNNNRVRRIDRHSGIIETIAGSGPSNGVEGYGRGSFCGDGGPATQACLNSPTGITDAANGDLFITDPGNARIRRIDASGTITTFVSGPVVGKATVGPAGYLYAGPIGRVLRYDAAGVAQTLAGVGDDGFSGDGGAALQAKVAGASDIAVDAEGNIFWTEDTRIRVIRYGAVLAPAGASIQAAAVGSTIRATVSDSSGQPLPSVRVDFTAPTSGASCILSNPFAITDATGIATVSCTSNCVAGTYAVIARPLTATASASVSFTNTVGPCRRRAIRH